MPDAGSHHERRAAWAAPAHTDGSDKAACPSSQTFDREIRPALALGTWALLACLRRCVCVSTSCRCFAVTTLGWDSPFYRAVAAWPPPHLRCMGMNLIGRIC